MKKFMVADLVKDLKEDQINQLQYRHPNISRQDIVQIINDYPDQDDQENVCDIIDRYNCNISDAEIFYDTYPNPVEWDDVDTAADALEIDPLDVTPDDIDNLNEIWDLGGSRGEPYKEIDTSIGKAFIYYALGQLYLLIAFDKGNPANYPISKSEAKLLSDADSLGKYYSENMRNNSKYSDLPGSWGCIGPNPDNPKRLATAEDIAKLPTKLQQYV